jgi:hypothetical protein
MSNKNAWACVVRRSVLALVGMCALTGCLPEDDEDYGTAVEVWDVSAPGGPFPSFSVTLYDSGSALASDGNYGDYSYLSGDRLDVFLNDENDLNLLTGLNRVHR